MAAKELVIDGITKRYGRVVAVREAHLTIEAGEFFSILGPSGSGKTTLLRTIAGFISPDSGRIVIGGEDVTALAPHRRPCNMVFQHYALFPHLNVADNVGFGLVEKRRPKKEIAERVEAMLELVRLPGLGDRKPSQLSGGQQQRVALARALINDPAVLLLDEPLGALDAKLRKAMQLELKRIQREVGMTFVYVTHDQDEALTMSDRIAVMNESVIEQIGGPKEVYQDPETLFVGSFVGEGAVLEAKVMATLDGGLAEVELSGTSIVRVKTDQDWNVGDDAKLLLRPEELTVGSGEHAPRSNALQGRVETIAFEGAVVRYVVALDTLPDIEILANPKDALSIVPGERAWVSWPEDAGRLLR